MRQEIHRSFSALVIFGISRYIDEDSMSPMSYYCFQKLLPLVTAITAISVVSCAPGARIAKKQAIQPSAVIGGKQFEQATAYATKSPWVSGNHIETLVNGDAFFSSMLKAIRSAKKTITFETYAFIQGQAAYQFTNAFCERARAGVKVHLVLDGVGAKNIGKINVTRMRAAGVDVHFYHPLSLFKLHQFNTRDHRKIMVVDGVTGYSGGGGIADAWFGNAHTSKHWRENYYRITGPVVAQLQKSFENNWIKTGGEPLSGPNYFPPLRRTGSLKAQAFISAPRNKLYTIPHLYRQAVASARKSIVIENSYLLLDRPMMTAILDARQRGVHVELVLPWKHTDSWPVRYLSTYQYDKLLRAGVHIYEYQTSMMHCKVMVIDGIFTSIGSANFDPRSQYINDESNVNVLDRDFAEEQLSVIEKDKLKSKRIQKALSPWNPLSFPPRAALSIIAPQL